jgi:hypothetical protein
VRPWRPAQNDQDGAVNDQDGPIARWQPTQVQQGGSDPRAAASAPRNRLGSVTFAIVLLGAVLALIPGTAALGGLLCLSAIIPAIVAYRRVRKGRATNRRRAQIALAAAPVFFILAVVLTPTPPAASTARAVDAASAATPVGTAPTEPPSPTTSAMVAPLPVAAPAVTLPSAATTTLAPAPIAPATVEAPARVAAPARPAPTMRSPVVRAAAPQAAVPQPAAAPAVSCNEATHYINAKGNCVLRPTQAAAAPAGATAKCGDGTYSFSQTRSGTCSRHGGVAAWL